VETPALLSRPPQELATAAGRAHRSAADATAGLRNADCVHPVSEKRDEGVLAQRAPRPGGPPHIGPAGIVKN